MAPVLCAEETKALQDGLASLKTTAPSQKEDVDEIRASFDSLIQAIEAAPETAAHRRMELDVNLEAFKVRSKQNAPLIKDLHGRIASLMKCHGIKAPGNGASKAR